MIWLNDGTILQNVDENQPILNRLSNENTPEFLSLAKSCGQTFNILIENRSKVNEACEQYSDIFGNTENEKGFYFALCFKLANICYFTPSQRNIRPQLIEVFNSMKQEGNEIAGILSDFFLKRADEFTSSYLKRGGSQIAADKILGYYECHDIDTWYQSLSSIKSGLSEYDSKFIKMISSDYVDCCKEYFLSICVNNFLHNTTTTPENLRQTAQNHPLPQTPQDKLIAAIFGFKFNEYISEAYNVHHDIVFPVHFLHLLSLKGQNEEDLLRSELDLATLRYIEMIMYDYNEQDQTGLRRWAPSYMKIVSADIKPALRTIFPSISGGLNGPFIKNVLEMPNFLCRDQKTANSLLSEIKSIINEIENGEQEEIDLSQVIQNINMNYPFCDDKMKFKILAEIGENITRFEGLSGQVISEMIDIESNASDSDENICAYLQQMMFDIILQTGKVPEYIHK